MRKLLLLTCALSIVALCQPVLGTTELPTFVRTMLHGIDGGYLSCAQALRRGQNLNATFLNDGYHGAIDYTGINWRGMEEISPLLGEDFSKYLSTLSNANVLLPGGGYAVYGVDLARRGHKVLRTSPQDFYRIRMEQLQRRPERLRECLAETYNSQTREIGS